VITDHFLLCFSGLCVCGTGVDPLLGKDTSTKAGKSRMRWGRSPNGHLSSARTTSGLPFPSGTGGQRGGIMFVRQYYKQLVLLVLVTVVVLWYFRPIDEGAEEHDTLSRIERAFWKPKRFNVTTGEKLNIIVTG